MTSVERRLVSVGNVVVDLVSTVPALPESGADVIASSSSLAPGGAFNVLVAAARQGLPGVYGGAHGTGPFGDLARTGLREAGVGILLDPSVGQDTGFDVALIEPSGERTFVTTIGAEAALTAERIGRVVVRDGDLVHISGYGLLREPNRSSISSWVSRVPEGAIVLLDPGPLGHTVDSSVLDAMRRRSDWYSCSQREARLATGEEDAHRAATALVEAGWRGVVVRLGRDGCLVADRDLSPQYVDGFAVEAVDTNGAGDAHVGAFLAALARGLDPVAAARASNACAARAVTRRGPATAPTLAEVREFLRRRGDLSG